MRLRHFGVLLLFALLFTPSVMAVDYYADVSGGNWTTMNWHLTSNSGPISGTYPGAAAGDRAIVDFQGISIIVDAVIPNPVTLAVNNTSCFVTIPAGSSLTTTGASSFGGGTGTLNITGGTLINNGPLTMNGAFGAGALNLSSGTIQNNAGGSLIIPSGSTFSFTGGTLTGTGATTLQAGAITSATGGALKTITGPVSISSTLTYGTGASNLQIGAGGTVTINSGGVFDLQNSSGIAGAGTINVLSGGTFIKSQDVFGTNITPTLNNGGLVQVDVATLVLSKGTHNNGSFFMNGAATGVEFAFGGTHTFTGTSTINGTGAAFFGGPTAVSGLLTITKFSNDGFASFSGTGTINLSGTWTWRAGTVSGITVNAGSGATVNYTGEGNATLTGSAQLVLTGVSGASTLNVNPGAGALTISGSAQITNGGNVFLLGDVTINSDGVATSRIVNNSMLSKSSGVGAAVLAVTVNNAGTVSVSQGTLKLQRGGAHSGAWSMPVTGTGIAFDGGVHQFTGGTFTGSTGTTTVGLSNGTMDVDVNISLPGNIAFQQTGGVLTGSGNFSIGTFGWTAGTMDNSSGAGMTISSGPVNASAPTGPLTLDGRTLQTSGTFTWDGTTFPFNILNGGNFTNGGTFNATGNGTIGSATGSITNNGSFNKTGGTAATVINAPITNNFNMTSQVSGQSLVIGAGGSQGGGSSLNTSAGALIDFFGGTYTVVPGTSPFQGSGIFRVNGGTLFINGSLGLLNPAQLQVQSGALSVAPGSTFQVNTFVWTGGALQNDGTTRAFAATIGSTAAMSLLGNHTLSIVNTLAYNASLFNFVTIGGTASLNVETGATMTMAAGSLLAGTSPDGLTINAAGTLDVSGGVAKINSGGTTSGGATIATGAGGTAEFGAGTFTMGIGTSITGAGTIAVSGATLNVDTALTFPNLNLSAGTLAGSGALTVNGGTWTGGTMAGTGATTVAATRTFNVNPGTAKTLARSFSNLGTLNLNDGLTINGSLSNASVMTLGAATIGGTGSIQNTGSVSGTAGGATVNVVFNNDGTVTSNIGTINLNGGGTHTGDFTAGNNITFGGTHSFAATSDLSGAGGYAFNGTSTLGGTYTAGSSSFGAGSLTTFNTTTGAALGTAFIGGNIAGTAAITISGAGSNWTAGSIAGSGGATIAGGGALAITGAGGQTLDRALTNNGTLTLNTSVAGTGSITNLNSFVANPAGTVTLQPAFSNQATALFQSGTVAFNGGYTQSAGSTQLNIGNFSSPLLVSISGGSVIGKGTIAANVSNGGTFAPGFSAGTITIAGNYTQTPAGILNAEVGANVPGTGYDQLVVTGNATLNGTLNVVLINSYVPADGDIYDLVTWGTRTGTFATVNLPAYPFGTLTPTYEPNAFRITVDAVGDLAVAKTGPATAVFGQNVQFTLTVTNNGPSPMNSVSLDDPTPANLTFVSTSGDCTTAFPCALGTIAAGVTKTIVATYTVSGGAGTTITNTATATSTSTDSVSANNVASASFFVELADLAVSKSGPVRVLPGQDVSFTIAVANGGASNALNVVVSDPTPAGLTFLSNTGACTTPFPCSLGTLASGATATITATYSVSGTLAGSSVTNTATVSTTTTDDPANNTSSATFLVDCLNSAPDALTPTGTTTETSGKLSWRGRGDSYIVFFGPAGAGCSTQFATTSSTSVPYSGLEEGKSYEWRVESIVNNCATRSSSCVKFSIPTVTPIPPDCKLPDAPLPRVVGQATSAKVYAVEWDAVAGAVRYEIDEADNPDFVGATRLSITATSQEYKHDALTEPIAFYYRVRAFVACTENPGPSSPTVRVVIIPLPPPTTPRKNVNVPVGSEELIVQQIFIPGEPGKTLLYQATTDRPWLTVRPSAGVITPDGVTLEVVADPKNLPNGTFTASVVVTITDGTSNIRTNATTTTSVPISVNLVTPVTPVAAKPGTSPYALVIPSAGHLDGIASQWQSDVRVTNAGFRAARYRLTFTPSAGTAGGVKQTDITVDAGATTALDDIISNWFGLGTLGDGANGMLEIVPLDDPATTSLTTVASSRTYNVTGNGTLGQYIPAIPFPSFVGRALPGSQQQVLSLQQIAQNAAYRTNVGLAEAAGAPATAAISIFNASGAKLTEIPVQLAAGEQRQMNQLLAQNGIELADGRLEVKVTGGDGKVTAYASVVDSASQDPLLVSGQPLSGAGATKFVLAGVANLVNSVADWRTDMRVFNYGSTSQPATLTFYPFNNGPSKSVSVLLGAHQVMTLDNVLKSQFEAENTGGVVHVSTLQPASLVVTGRTYNQTSSGTFGQFVPAVTAQQAVGANERTLHILQVEDSSRYRTNVGIAEVTGKPAVVELQIVLPDSKITPTVQVPLAANEFRQFNPIRELGVGNVYNARISVRVISGEGRVTAYGSVIDEFTQDPTYVPAQ